METKELIFNQEERTIIAEFIFSYQTDILIKSDGLDLVDVLKNHDLITELDSDMFKADIINNTCDIYKLNMIILNKISVININGIMKEYYGK